MNLFCQMILMNCLCTFSQTIDSRFGKSDIYEAAQKLQKTIKGQVLLRGDVEYETRRFVHNGHCNHLYPDMIVVPIRTKDVAKAVKIARKYKLEISVRSGGHSSICQSTKHGGLHLDMRSMNKVHRVGQHMAKLGPGSEWKRVLEIIPRDKFSMVHGQCLSVGVGGYLLGGGVNAVGGSERFGSGAQNVIQYTMVTANGDIALVTRDNVTLYKGNYKQPPEIVTDSDLFLSLMGAGASYGIVTEFLYKIFPRPETKPIIALAYVDTKDDLKKFDALRRDDRWSVSFYSVYYWRQRFPPGNFETYVGVNVLPRILKYFQRRGRYEPLFVSMVDLRAWEETDRNEAQKALEYYGIRLAKEDLVSFILPNMNDIDDYESLYMSNQEIKKYGFQALESANIMGLPDFSILEEILFHHPVFGLRNKNSLKARSAGCEFCYWIMNSYTNENFKLPLQNSGNVQLDLSCTFPPDGRKSCSKYVAGVKRLLDIKARKLGIKPSQYVNTPSCDVTNDFHERYWGPYVPLLLKEKKRWDPDNVFHFCQSVGSSGEDCCPFVPKQLANNDRNKPKRN